MTLIGQGLVLMIAGMAIVYVFLYLLIVVCGQASRFVLQFEALMPDEPKKVRKPRASTSISALRSVGARHEGTPVKAPVPGCVLRILVQDGQRVTENDDILVMDVMKMETPIKAPCPGTVTVIASPADKVATGATVAFVS